MGSRLTPFATIGVDPSWGLARDWSLPVALLGASAALLFLTRQEHFLSRLAPRTRWGSELGVLLVGPAALLLALGVGALLSSGPAAWEAAVAWCVGSLLLIVHLAGLGLLLLVPRAPGSLRVAGLCVLGWGLPALLGAGRFTSFLDTTAYFRFDSSLAIPPVAWLETVTPLALLVSSLLAPRPRLPASAR